MHCSRTHAQINCGASEGREKHTWKNKHHKLGHPTQHAQNNSLAKNLLKLQSTAERILSLHFLLLPKQQIKIKTAQKIINFPPSSFSSPKYTCQNFKAYRKNLLFVLCVFLYWILAWPLLPAPASHRNPAQQPWAIPAGTAERDDPSSSISPCLTSCWCAVCTATDVTAETDPHQSF